MMGMPLAAVAFHFGANDVQGTVVREQIFHAAGARTETEQKVDEAGSFRPRGRAHPGAARHALRTSSGGEDTTQTIPAMPVRENRRRPSPSTATRSVLRRPPLRRRLRGAPRGTTRSSIYGSRTTRRGESAGGRSRAPGALRRRVLHRGHAQLSRPGHRCRRALRRRSHGPTCSIQKCSERKSVDDTDFGTREFATLDLDGNLVTFFEWRSGVRNRNARGRLKKPKAPAGRRHADLGLGPWTCSASSPRPSFPPCRSCSPGAVFLADDVPRRPHRHLDARRLRGALILAAVGTWDRAEEGAG